MRKTILLFIIGLLAVCFRVYELNNSSFLDEVIERGLNISLSVIATVLFSIALFKYIRNKSAERKLNYFPILICVFIAFGYNITPPLYALQDRSPIVLSCKYNPGAWHNCYLIDFREDGTYKMEIAEFMSSHCSRGTYTMKDNIIACSKSIVDTIVLSNRFLIRTDTVTNTTFDRLNRDSTYTFIQRNLYEIDSKESIIPNSVIFEIIDVK